MKKQINLDPNTTRALCKIAAQTNHTRKRLNAVVQREGSGLSCAFLRVSGDFAGWFPES